jgi:hypothetical protein
VASWGKERRRVGGTLTPLLARLGPGPNARQARRCYPAVVREMSVAAGPRLAHLALQTDPEELPHPRREPLTLIKFLTTL